MATTHFRKRDTDPAASGPTGSSREVPWQIWVTVALLGLEGVGDLLSVPSEPAAAVWLAAKCLFVVGLIRGWRWVFVLFLVVAGLHVLAFSTLAPFIAFLNLVLVLLVGSALRSYFPGDVGHRPGSETISQTSMYDRSLDV
ncbi:hypothetical protein [Aquisphaera insulae]|uniref:hypothetical protein n=1 Tax=Aquisphaera insulae TaxID=2712864 RepID=UPI00196A3E6B|nr:hypothetical protein [Aquisphaera insulae]